MGGSNEHGRFLIDEFLIESFGRDAGAIGRRYRRQDEIGTPYCVTVDFDTLEDQAVTVRHRDSMTQERIGLDAIAGWLRERLDP